jgi:predicted nucleotidyltransferase component of viral defense system
LRNLVNERRTEGTPDNVIINAIKEELQYPVLDFIYNNRAYSHLIMYGGTLLRIGYGLSRMSEDLDFQTDKKFDFVKFKEALTTHFKNTYGVEIEMTTKTGRLTGTDYAFIKFPDILGEIGLKGHGLYTKLQIRFDMNNFPQASDFATETIPITKNTCAFSIKTYPLATLMASKVAAVFLRQKRGIGDEISDCKPRDIYDLMWYMGQKIIPNMEYLKAVYKREGKNMAVGNILEVFGALKTRVTSLNDKLFAHDLLPFFYNPLEYDDWHRNWKERFRLLQDSYKIYKVKVSGGKPDLLEIKAMTDFSSDNRYFHFYFSTEESAVKVKFTCCLSEYWYLSEDLKIFGEYRNKDIENSINSGDKLTELDYAYAGLFYGKIEDYLKRNDYIAPQPELKTKLIRTTGDKLNVKTQIFLDRNLLIKIKFEDLL